MSDSLLREWETGAGRHPWETLADFSAAPEGSSSSASIGMGNAQILQRRRARFGDELPLLSACPRCGEWVEFSAPPSLFQPVAPTEESHLFNWDDWEIRFRLPTVSDLMGARRAEDPAQFLRNQCLLGCTHLGTAATLCDAAQSAWEDHLDQLDPLAVIAFSLACPECGEMWEPIFEPAREYQRELDIAARNLLSEVDTLARAYGWDEQTTLSLSPARRRIYLEMVSA
jgi:rRNA maturation protein Nop10